MDKYKVLINDELYQTYNGLGQQSYRIHHPSQTMQDIVVLSFSREEQAFKASILNPSEHTLYLFNNNSLGFTVSRGIRFPHTRTNRSKMSKQHKRWRMAAERDNERGLGLPNKIFSVAVTDLNNITLPYNDRMFRQSNYLNEDERYMIYRGLLLHKHTDGWNERPYKTYSNTLKLIRHGQNWQTWYYTGYGGYYNWDFHDEIQMHIQPTSNPGIVRVYFDSLPYQCYDFIEKGVLKLATEYRDTSSVIITGDKSRRIHNGDPDNEARTTAELQHANRSKYFLHRFTESIHLVLSSTSYEIITTEDLNRGYKDYTINLGKPHGLHKWNDRSTFNQQQPFIRHPYIALIYSTDNDTIKKLWRFELLNKNVTWTDADEDIGTITDIK